MYALAVNSVVDLQQQVAFFHLHKILYFHLSNITVHLRADKRGLPAHVCVIGELGMARERRQLPGVQNHQHSDDADGGRSKQ
ncbi:hypothetical protein D3C71_1382280 [compost metagenome]